jgi:hypothetical protein
MYQVRLNHLCYICATGWFLPFAENEAFSLQNDAFLMKIPLSPAAALRPAQRQRSGQP